MVRHLLLLCVGATAGCESLRLTLGKALFFRRGAQTLRREKPPPAVRVCASLLGKPYSSVEGRKPFTRKSRRRRCEFAPHSRESLILPLRGANPSPGKAAGASVSLSPIPGKALFFRRGAQTLHPEKPRRLREFAPPSRESLILPLRGANPLAGKAPAAGVSLRLPPGKALFLRRGAQTLHPEEPPAAVRVCAPFS